MAVIARLKGEWEDEYRQWQRRDLSARQYVYVGRTASICRREWSAGRMHAGADRRDAGGQEGVDWLSDRHAGERAELEGTARRLESARLGRRAASRYRRWRARVLESLDEAFPTTRHQRCWLHKTLNVLDKLPKSMQPTRTRICARSGCRRAGRGGSGDDDIRREIRAQIR